VRVPPHQRVEQKKIDRRDQACGKGETAMSPAKPECKSQLRKIRADGEEAPTIGVLRFPVA
jgi:hypothetical protein